MIRRFSFDSQNRLTCVSASETAPCNRLEVAYDGDGRRVRDRTATPAAATERFFLGDLFTLERPSGAEPQGCRRT